MPGENAAASCGSRASRSALSPGYDKLFPGEGDFAAADRDLDRVPGGKLAGEDLLRQRIFDFLLHRAFERPRPEDRIEADLRDLRQCRGRDIDPDLELGQTRFERL